VVSTGVSESFDRHGLRLALQEGMLVTAGSHPRHLAPRRIAQVPDAALKLVEAFRRELDLPEVKLFNNPVSAGASDGHAGVQWSAYLSKSDGYAYLGVNLEGMKYDGWPIARLIQNEISQVRVLELLGLVPESADARVKLWRDVWGAGGGRRHETILDCRLHELGEDSWRQHLVVAYSCLNENDHRGRARQGCQWVSPHLHACCQLWQEASVLTEAQVSILTERKRALQPVYDWMTESSR